MHISAFVFLLGGGLGGRGRRLEHRHPDHYEWDSADSFMFRMIYWNWYAKSLLSIIYIYIY